jgi:DeoR/GlpR family transcriptional regulator of sugar metabolism
MKNRRQEQILTRLHRTGRVEVTQLAAALGVSEITARRDLVELESAGFLQRVHGGAVRTAGRSSDRPYHLREQQQLPAKRAIAARAAQFVGDGDAIALDVGSTVLQMVDFLGEVTNLTILTANLRTAHRIASSPTVRRPYRLIVSGGTVRDGELSMTGQSAIDHFRKMRVDIAFLGVAGVSDTAGLTDFNVEDAEIKRVLVESARKVVVLADSTKVGQETFAHIADLQAVDVIITTDDADPDALDRLRGSGPEVVTVATPVEMTN